MDAIQLLKNDHAALKDLFRRYHELEPGQSPQKKSLFAQVRDELQAHAQIEEEIFYPCVREAKTTLSERLVREAYEEHRLVKTLLRELAKGSPGEADFDARFKVLKENVLHHAKEEENDLFLEARQHLSPADLLELGRELADRKHKIGGRLHPTRPAVTRARRAVSRVKRVLERSIGQVKRTLGRGAHRRSSR